MANINAYLPSAIAIPFHPATEAMQHDNVMRPIIPKTQLISAYTKLRDEQESAHSTPSKQTIVQLEEAKKEDKQLSFEQIKAEKRRVLFFSRRERLTEFDKGDKNLDKKYDFKRVRTVILACYHNAVNPYSEATVTHNV